MKIFQATSTITSLCILFVSSVGAAKSHISVSSDAIVSNVVVNRGVVKNNVMELASKTSEGTDDHRSLQFLAPEDTNPCDSELVNYVSELVEDLRMPLILSISNNGIQMLAFLYKILIDQSEEGEYFGVAGEYTDMVTSHMDSIETFWSLQDAPLLNSTDPVWLFGAHGADIQSSDDRVALCEVLAEANVTNKGLSEATNCTDWSDKIDGLIGVLTKGYNNSLLTLNAFAQFPQGVILEGLQQILADQPPSIVIGDGLLNFLEYSSINSNLGIEFIMGHEWCHIVQVRTGLLDPETYVDIDIAEKERLELMCDAFSAYYMGHPSGGNVSVSEVDSVSKQAMTLGDPQQDDASGLMFHGTPGQRECAAVWGANLAQENSDRTISVEKLTAEFDEVYAAIFDGSPMVCPDITGDVDCSPPSYDSASNRFWQLKLALAATLALSWML